MTNQFLHYLIESTIYLSLFLLVFRILLANLTHFNWMRFYLLVSLVLSIILPLVIIPMQGSNITFSNSVSNIFTLGMSTDQLTELQPVNLNSSSSLLNTFMYAVLLIYMAGVIYKTFLLLKNLFRIRNFIINNSKIKLGPNWIVNIKNEIPAFSFFNYIFINNKYKNLEQNEIEVIKEHEKAHVHQRHTIDILFTEIAHIVFWFNPLFIYLKKQLQTLHEFIVDEITAGNGFQKKEYANLLLNLVTEKKLFNLVTSFSGKNIMHRISMLTKPRSSSFAKPLFLVVVPLAMVILLSFSMAKNPTQEISTKQSGQKNDSYTLGKITWVGNSQYKSEKLSKLLGLKEGDAFSFDDLSNRLFKGEITDFYLNNGYVFYKSDFATNQRAGQIMDVTITIYEGVRAKIGKIIIIGNKTVPTDEILKKMKINPGDMFSKTKIIKSVRAIASLDKFENGKILPTPIPVPESTNKEYAIVDLEFNVTEK